MKKLLVLTGMILALSSCIETKQMLYNWDDGGLEIG